VTGPGRCTATACLFSGRPDPQWQVPSEMARRLERLWQQLPSLEAKPPPPPVLGYRGCALDCGPRRRWFAYGGMVAKGETYRFDPDRSFEREVLRSAPPGLLSPEFLRLSL